MDIGNPLTTSSLGAVILLMAVSMRVMFNEIKRLNNERLRDMKDIGETDRKLIRGVTIALNNLRKKIDGMNGSNHV